FACSRYSFLLPAYFLSDLSVVSEQINAPKEAKHEATGYHTRDCRSGPSHQPVRRIRRALRHDRYLVDAIAFSVLPESLLRSVGAEFLSISSRLPRDRAATDLPHPTQRPVAQLACCANMFNPLSA